MQEKGLWKSAKCKSVVTTPWRNGNERLSTTVVLVRVAEEEHIRENQSTILPPLR